MKHIQHILLVAAFVLFALPTWVSLAQASDTAPVPVSDATVRVTRNPKLELTYDRGHKEALLKASFDISINGGKNGINVYDWSTIHFFDQNGNESSTNSMQGMPLTADDREVKTTVDSAGVKLFIIPAGKTVRFTQSATIDPKSLFAGTYHATIHSIYAIDRKSVV